MEGEILPTWGQIGVLGTVIVTLIGAVIGTRRAWVAEVAAAREQEAGHAEVRVQLVQDEVARLERMLGEERDAHERTREELMRLLRTRGEAAPVAADMAIG